MWKPSRQYQGPKDPVVRGVRGVYSWVDDKMAAVLQAIPTRCSVGCAHCCEMQVLVHASEAHVLAWNLRNDRMPGAQGVIENLRRQDAVMERLSTKLTGEDPLEQMQAMASLYWNERLACAFLDTLSRTCRVYKDRPSQCRIHYVTTDPERCSREVEERSIGKVHVGREGDDMFQMDILARLAHTSESHGLPVTVGPMQGMVLEAFGIESRALGIAVVEGS